MSFNASRRNFLRGLAGISMLGSTGCFTIGKSGSKKIRLAAVGIMGKGFSDWTPMVKSGKAELVALCDADATQLAKAQKKLKDNGIDLESDEFFKPDSRVFDEEYLRGITKEKIMKFFLSQKIYLLVSIILMSKIQKQTAIIR